MRNHQDSKKIVQREFEKLSIYRHQKKNIEIKSQI